MQGPGGTHELWAANSDPTTHAGLSEHGDQCAHHTVLGSVVEVGLTVCTVGLQLPGFLPAFLGNVAVCHGAVGSQEEC